jgi:ethanolamine utilization protein EutN
MFIARIDGAITATIKHRSLDGFRLLIGQRLDADKREVGEPIIMLDNLGADIGTEVIVTSDGEFARRMVNNKATPSRMVVVGIVDETVIRKNGAGVRD